MVVHVHQMVLAVLHVNALRVLLVNDVKIRMVVLVNHVRIEVFVLIQVVVHIYANVVRVLKDPIASKVGCLKFL
jgi:hypothetical protein